MKVLLLFVAFASAAEVRFGAPAPGGEPKATTVLAFSPDGKALAAGAADGSVRLYSAATGRELWRVSAHKESVWALAFARDGRIVASGGQDARLLLHDARTGNLLRTIRPGRSAVTQLAFLPDGRLVCDGERDNLEFWDPATGLNVRSMTSHEESIEGLAVSSDGRFIATSSKGQLHLWDAPSGRRLFTKTPGGPYALDLAFSADEGALFARDRNNDRLYRVDVPGGGRDERIAVGERTEKSLLLPGSGLIGLAVREASGDGWSLELLDPVGGRRETVFRGREDAGAVLAFSADGKYAASAGSKGVGTIWATTARAAPVEKAVTAVSTAVMRALMETWSDPARAETDFDGRRRLYAESKDYDPYGEAIRDRMNLLRETVEEERFAEALTLANELLSAHPVLTEVHGYAATACLHLADTERGAYHQRYARGLVDSVRRSGDGKSTGTAFKLVHMAEQEAVASTFAGPVLARSSLESGGRKFDAWQVGTETVYLDITAIWDWSLRRFGAAE